VSAFASKHTKVVSEVPGEPGKTVTIRKLTGKEVETAQEAHATAFATGRARNWSKTLRQVMSAGAKDSDAKAAMADPMAGYDRFVMMHAGIVSWTLTPTTDRKELIAEINDLDDEASEYLATEILRLTKPQLFQTPVEAEAAAKNA
jgi:hypothetical protein